MNVEEFSKLPLLLARAKVKEVLGVTDRDIATLREAKQLTTWTNGKKGAKGKYKKVEVAVLAGFKV